MAFSEELHSRVEKILTRRNLESKRMFGGICYLLHGNMAFGIYKDNLIVRLGSKEKSDAAIQAGTARPFDITGTPMKGWVMVPESRLSDDRICEDWIKQGLESASSLPPK